MGRKREFDIDEALKKSLMVFWKKGYHATSLQDIEVATGIARMRLYYVFKDKEGLFLAGLNRYIETSRELYKKFLRGRGLVDLEDLITAYGNPEQLGDARGWGCLMMNAVVAQNELGKDVQTTIEDFRQFTIDQIDGCLNTAILSGELRPDIHTRDQAELILTVLWGMKALMRHSEGSTAVEPAIRALTSVLYQMKTA
jgi:AcrR family transcriptional regulator